MVIINNINRRPLLESLFVFTTGLILTLVFFVLALLFGPKKLKTIIISEEIISKASNLTTSTMNLVVPKITCTNIVKKIALITKYITENLNGLTTSPAPNKAPSIKITGSVPIAIKLPIKLPTKPMLLVKPIKKNIKFETIIKIEKYNKGLFT
jgi:hypothetical protein